MKECSNLQKNLQFCNCSYEFCSRKGKCCECIIYHRQNNELPACYFSKKDERTYNRSITFFISTKNNSI
jgi:hypothetical protein